MKTKIVLLALLTLHIPQIHANTKAFLKGHQQTIKTLEEIKKALKESSANQRKILDKRTEITNKIKQITQTYKKIKKNKEENVLQEMNVANITQEINNLSQEKENTQKQIQTLENNIATIEQNIVNKNTKIENIMSNVKKKKKELQNTIQKKDATEKQKRAQEILQKNTYPTLKEIEKKLTGKKSILAQLKGFKTKQSEEKSFMKVSTKYYIYDNATYSRGSSKTRNKAKATGSAYFEDIYLR